MTKRVCLFEESHISLSLDFCSLCLMCNFTFQCLAMSYIVVVKFQYAPQSSLHPEMAIAAFAKTLEYLKYKMQLNPESKKYTKTHFVISISACIIHIVLGFWSYRCLYVCLVSTVFTRKKFKKTKILQ
jgi:hypothetical protein